MAEFELNPITDSLSLSDSVYFEIIINISDTISLEDSLFFRKAFVVLNLLTPIVTQIDVTGAIVKIINIDTPIG